jgi:hypothetical protein
VIDRSEILLLAVKTSSDRLSESLAAGSDHWRTMSAAAWFVTGAMAAHLPALLETTGASPTQAIAAATLVGPAQVAARLAEFLAIQRAHPLMSARIGCLPASNRGVVPRTRRVSGRIVFCAFGTERATACY